jgi:holliday junction DNA helicase RuvB
MAIISSRRQPPNPDGEPKRRRETSKETPNKATPKDDLGVQSHDNSEEKSQEKPEKSTDNQLLQPAAAVDEQGKQEESIRPHRFADYIGQKDLKDVLEIAIKAAKSRGEVLDHLLLYGPPGLGKTTMAMILASEMGVNYKITSAPALERPRDIAGLLVNLKPGDVLFIDEIHRLSRMTEEILYPAMEDYRLDVTVGKGTSARTRSIPLAKFTLVGATTRVGALTSPLRDRFGLVQKLRFYEVDELSKIVIRSAQLLNTPINAEGAEEVARRARGTPRIANRLLKRVRDYAEVKSSGEINREVAAEALQLFQVDPMGLDWTDRRMLSVIIEQFNGGPVGLETIAAATGEDTQTIEEVYEPYLMQIGYLSRTPRGRTATTSAYKHMGFKSPKLPNDQLSLLSDE